MLDLQTPTITSEQVQKEHYDLISREYGAHYDHLCSRQYVAKFMCRPMFAGIDLTGLKVLDAMCGGGQLTEYLLGQGAEVTGLDISPKRIKSFQRNWPSCGAVCASALESGLKTDSFDCVGVIGGLHHLHPNLDEAISEFHRILKPGGYLCFAEPHAGSLPDHVRRRWYKHDELFSENEAGIDLTALKDRFSAAFTFTKEQYLGSVAYLLVYNSMVFRIPLFLKPAYGPLLMMIEPAINKFQSKFLACFVAAQWQKK